MILGYIDVQIIHRKFTQVASEVLERFRKARLLIFLTFCFRIGGPAFSTELWAIRKSSPRLIEEMRAKRAVDAGSIDFPYVDGQYGKPSV